MNDKDKKLQSTLAMELVLRLLAVACLSWFLWRVIESYQHAPNPLLILVAGAEALNIGLVVFARAPMVRSLHPADVALTLAGTYLFPLLAELDHGRPLVPGSLAGLMQLIGILLQVYAKLWLGRSFGLLPANRGVVERGPYRWVRHPIYASYLIGHIGFLLGLFTWQNLFALCFLYVLQIWRIFREESVLGRDERYRAYQQAVRWRMIPGVF